MSIREQIMALPSGSFDNAHRVAHEAADLADARERELLERQAAMIAELRGLAGYDKVAHEFYPIDAETMLDIINKYEALK